MIRYGIIGYGSFAERTIAPGIAASPNSRVVAIQKRDLTLARAKAAEAGIPLAFSSPGELAAHPDVDAVFIVSSNNAHCAETLAAAGAGKPVIVEKPIAMSVAEADTMIAACRKADVPLMVGHMPRVSPPVNRMRELIASGRYGAPVFARADFSYEARLSKRPWLFDRVVAGGGPLFDIGVHCLDTLRYVLDDEVVSTKAHLAPRPTAEVTEASAHLSLAFRKGALGTISCSFATPILIRTLEVVCREAIFRLEEFTASNVPLTLSIREGRGSNPPSEWVEHFDVPDLYEQEVTLFSNVLLHGGTHHLTGESARENMVVLEEAMRQAAG